MVVHDLPKVGARVRFPYLAQSIVERNYNMKIIDIYEKFGIPPNLQSHMLRVCGIVYHIQKHWTGQAVDWDMTKRVALLHDLGNIVKFDFEKHPEFLEDEQKNIERWKQVQSEVIQKYGADDDEVTKKMLEELGASPELIEIIFSKRFANSVEVKNSDNWTLKLLYYADLRTLPFGIGSLEERISDIQGRMPKYTKRPDFASLVDACRGIEKQVAQNIDIPVSEINATSVVVNKDFLNLSL